MARPDNDQILEDANKLKNDRFKGRDAMIAARIAERYNKTTVDVPNAYKKTAHQHDSNLIEDEGRQVGTLVHAMPVPHIPPPSPEDQPLTTTEEQFLIAFHSELEATFGPVWWQSTLEQIHNNISWDYLGWRKVPYKGQPKPPEAGDALAEAEWALKNERFKKDAGVRAYADYRHVPTSTAYPQGNVYDPDRFYEIKEVAERDLMDTYGITKNRDGSYSKKTDEPSTTPSGYPENQGGSETRIRVVEYWDREWCVIVAETSQERWLGMRRVKSAYLLEEWQHNWGRTPYFARPAFITEQLDEDKKFAGPLDGVYREMPEHKILRTMGHAVAYQTAFAPMVVTTEKDGDTILDASDKMAEFLEFEPGKGRQLAPGQKVGPLGQSPEVKNLFMEIAASQARIEHYSTSAVTKGISPGADTANAALSNLHRFQLSTLDPMAQQASRQASAMYRFVLERVREMQDRCYALDRETDQYLSLGSADVVSVNVTAKVVPDQGQFQLLIEKHALELWMAKAITLQEMYAMWGKENPEQYVLELKAEKMGEMLEPVVMQQIISDLGMMDAVNAMLQANAQGGTARDAVPGLMQKFDQMNPTGQGQGSAGQPRGAGVRSPVVSETTQPQMGGY